MKCLGAPQATLAGSWSLRNHHSSALSMSQIVHGAPCRLSDVFLTCSGAPQASLEDLGGSWRLSELAESRFIGPVGVWETYNSRSVVPVGVWRPPGMLRSHDLSCLSVSGRLTSHDLSCLSVSEGLPECSEVTIYRACRCLEASQGATRGSEQPSTDLRRT